MTKSRNNKPPLACGFAPILRSPLGANSESSGHGLMHRFWLVSLHKVWFPAVAGEETSEFPIRHPGKHGWIRDLVAIEMKNGQHRTIAYRVQKFIAVPARSQWPRFGLAVSHHATCEQVWIVEHGAASVHDRIAQFSPFVDGARSFGRRMARNSSRKRELFE